MLSRREALDHAGVKPIHMEGLTIKAGLPVLTNHQVTKPWTYLLLMVRPDSERRHAQGA